MVSPGSPAAPMMGVGASLPLISPSTKEIITASPMGFTSPPLGMKKAPTKKAMCKVMESM